LIGTAIGQVFLGEAASLAQSDPDALARMFRKLSRRLLALGLVPAIVLMLFGPELVRFFLGINWIQSGVYVQWLSISFLLKFGFDGLIDLGMVGRNDFDLAWAIIRLVLSCGAVTAASALGLPATSCIALLAISLAIGYLLKVWFWNVAISRLKVTP